jgi:hypothetical protein
MLFFWKNHPVCIVFLEYFFLGNANFRYRQGEQQPGILQQKFQGQSRTSFWSECHSRQRADPKRSDGLSIKAVTGESNCGRENQRKILGRRLERRTGETVDI